MKFFTILCFLLLTKWINKRGAIFRNMKINNEKIKKEIQELKNKYEFGLRLKILIENGASGFDIMFELENQSDSYITDHFYSLDEFILKDIGNNEILNKKPKLIEEFKEDLRNLRNDLEYQKYKLNRLKNE